MASRTRRSSALSGSYKIYKILVYLNNVCFLRSKCHNFGAKLTLNDPCLIVTQSIRRRVFVLTLTFVWSSKVWFTWEKQWDDDCGFVLLTLGLVLSFAPAGVECFPASEGWEWSRSRNPLSLTDRSTSHCWTSEDANMKRDQIKLNFVSSHICRSYDVLIQSTH